LILDGRWQARLSEGRPPMEQVTIANEGRQGMIGDLGGLPANRVDWPDGARQAFSEVLRQLDGWCRERDRPRSTNAAVAEQAVRQAW
jgi:hypothetical protein